MQIVRAPRFIVDIFHLQVVFHFPREKKKSGWPLNNSHLDIPELGNRTFFFFKKELWKLQATQTGKKIFIQSGCSLWTETFITDFWSCLLLNARLPEWRYLTVLPSGSIAWSTMGVITATMPMPGIYLWSNYPDVQKSVVFVTRPVSLGNQKVKKNKKKQNSRINPRLRIDKRLWVCACSPGVRSISFMSPCLFSVSSD